MSKISADEIRNFAGSLTGHALTVIEKAELLTLLYVLADEREQAVAPAALVTDEMAAIALDAFYGGENWRSVYTETAHEIIAEMRKALEAVAPLLREEAK